MARLIGEVGPTGLTFSALARLSGLSAPALAQRFGSKHALLLAFAARAPASVAPVFAVARARARSGSPLDALVTAFVGLAAGQRTRESVANHLAVLQLDLVDPELRVHAVAHARAVRREARLLVDEAVAAGELVPVDAAALTRACWVAFNGAMVTWAIDGTGSLSGWIGGALDRTLAPHRR